MLELIQEYDSDSLLSDFDMESTNKRIEEKRRQTHGIFLQFQEQDKNALTSLMIAAKTLMNNKCKSSKLRHSF